MAPGGSAWPCWLLGRGLPSLLRPPASAMSTPLSSLSVWPLSDSWDRVAPAEERDHWTSLKSSKMVLFNHGAPPTFIELFSFSIYSHNTTWASFIELFRCLLYLMYIKVSIYILLRNLVAVLDL